MVLGLAIFAELRLVTDRRTDGQTDGQTHDDSITRAVKIDKLSYWIVGFLERLWRMIGNRFPDDEDLKGAVDALIRLQDLYELSPDKVASGQLYSDIVNPVSMRGKTDISVTYSVALKITKLMSRMIKEERTLLATYNYVIQKRRYRNTYVLCRRKTKLCDILHWLLTRGNFDFGLIKRRV